MIAVNNRFEEIFGLLRAGQFIPALLFPFFHNEPIEVEVAISPGLLIPRRFQPCCPEQLS